MSDVTFQPQELKDWTYFIVVKICLKITVTPEDVFLTKKRFTNVHFLEAKFSNGNTSTVLITRSQLFRIMGWKQCYGKTDKLD